MLAVACATLLGPCLASGATLYERGATPADWVVFDTSPAGATVNSVRDDALGSRVIALSGDGRSNGYRLGGLTSVDGWNNTTEHHLAFSLAASEAYTLYVRVDTAQGWRYLIYNAANVDAGLSSNGRNVVHGLGWRSRDGRWYRRSRDLAADLRAFEPDNELIAVQGLLVRGNVRLDDIALSDSPVDTTVLPRPGAALLANADADDAARWRLFDKRPAGATVAIVEDALRGSRVYEFQGDGTRNGRAIGGRDAIDGLRSSAGRFGFALRTREPYAVYVRVRTSRGLRYLIYTASNTDRGLSSNGISLRFGLGSKTRDGAWHDISRDLALDLARFDPDAVLESVHGIYVRGSLRLDDVQLSDTGSAGGGAQPDQTSVRAGEAARLLSQASFGPTDADIAEVQALGPAAWIDAQLSLPVQPQLPRVRAIAANDSKRGPRHEIWWLDVVQAQDQLRQRVAFALSELFVVADTGYTLGNAQFGMAAYYDRLLAGAFGSYRELLEQVTLSPVMGVWLSMLQNARGERDWANNTRADENFAREVLQLFSIGLQQLNRDGTPVRVNGEPVASFSNETVAEYARVFTGWNFAGVDRWNKLLIASDNDYVSPMQPYEPARYHDAGEKTLLNGVISPAGVDPETDLRIALDSIASHPNVAPFIARRLIASLVTSNPTPGYVGRVADAFEASEGNLGQTVKALLLDREARDGPGTVANFGKLREPLLRLSHLWRAFGIEPGSDSAGGLYNVASPQKENLDGVLGQAVLKASSVFNFFSPDHSPVGPLLDNGLRAPEAELYTDALILSVTDRINRQVQFYHDAGSDNERRVSHLVLAAERELAHDPDALLDRLDRLLLSGTLSAELRTILDEHIRGIPIAPDDELRGRSMRVRDAITLIMASPDYLVQM